jgi:hypothetical protein
LEGYIVADWTIGWGEATSGNLANDLTGLELIGLDEDLNTFDLPADVTISDYFKTALDDTTATAARATLEIVKDVLPTVADDAAKTAKGRSSSSPVGMAVFQIDTGRAYICTGVA